MRDHRILSACRQLNPKPSQMTEVLRGRNGKSGFAQQGTETQSSESRFWSRALEPLVLRSRKEVTKSELQLILCGTVYDNNNDYVPVCCKVASVLTTHACSKSYLFVTR